MATKSGSDENNFDEELSHGEGGDDHSNQAKSASGSLQDEQEAEESEEFEVSENENGAEDNNGGDEEDVVEEVELEEETIKKDSTKARSKSSTILKSRYIWVDKVPIGTKSHNLEELFEKYAKVLAIKIIRGPSELLAFVKLETIEQAQRCFDKLNKFEFKGSILELSKDRPTAAAQKITDKIGFKDIRYRPRPYRSRGSPPSSFRHDSSRDRRGGYNDRDQGSRFNSNFRSRDEGEELLKLEREKLKLERLKLERERLELLKLRTIADRPKMNEDKRRPMDGIFVAEKRGGYSDYARREDFSSRKIDTDRKGFGRPSFTGSSRGRFEDNSRGHVRYESSSNNNSSSSQYRSQAAPASSWHSSTSDRWQSSSYETSAPRIMSSTISSTPSSRIHSNSDNIPSRGYFNNSNSRRY